MYFRGWLATALPHHHLRGGTIAVVRVKTTAVWGRGQEYGDARSVADGMTGEDATANVDGSVAVGRLFCACLPTTNKRCRAHALRFTRAHTAPHA
jgi:hypothetical protein